MAFVPLSLVCSHLLVQVHLDLLRLGALALRDPLVDLRLELVVGNDVLVLEPARC